MGSLIKEVLGPGGIGWVLTQLLILGIGTGILCFLLDAFPGTLKRFSTYIKYVAMMLGVIVVLRVVLDLFREVGKVMGV
ncbi:hypothetical protein [Desulforamulus reducens]|nr:hypothetical protein [Desulforamulus reducens]